eukprot:TRINITY_DN6899_c3_g1_i1.p1 TRINITY_DN6899_c3_g1~~TRINITY_DN6899_c3_g1_i1.p1  ORF type:complete len:632 (+),score=93.54 TRINITY_DN6899_c3_g1_i1:117-2012(+)
MDEERAEFLRKLKQRYPELESKTLLETLNGDAVDDDTLLYRLCCKEGGNRDPFSIVGYPQSSPTAQSNSNNQSTPRTHSLQQPQPPQQQPQPSPSVSTCLACNATLTLQAGSVTSYPVRLNCPSCGVTSRLTEPLMNMGRVQRPEENMRAKKPSCDFCGYQTNTMEERQVHMKTHVAEISVMERTKEKLKESMKPAVTQELQKHAGKWRESLKKHITSNMDDKETYAMKADAVKQLETLVKAVFPDAKIFLFGSTSTGTGELKSDLDVAVSIASNRRAVDEMVIIHSLWSFLDNLNLPWYSDHTGEYGLHKITKTRVPILGYSSPPTLSMLKLDTPEARTLVFKVKDASDFTTLRNKFKNHKAVVDISEHPDDKQLHLLCKSQLDAIALRLKFPSEFLQAPNIFRCTWDLSAKTFGVRNSALIRKYTKLRSVRTAAVAVKMWSRAWRVNDPRNGLLSSYAVMLLFVYYLAETGVLQFQDPASISFDDCEQVPPLPDLPEGEKDLSIAVMLFMGFFDFYSRSNKFNWDEHVVSLRKDPSREGPISKESLGWTSKNAIIVERAKCVRYHICIEDPYEAADQGGRGMLNLGRKIPEHRALRIQLAFKNAYRDVCAGDIESLLGVHPSENFTIVD